jgi:hypothetical protein
MVTLEGSQAKIFAEIGLILVAGTMLPGRGLREYRPLEFGPLVLKGS